MAPIHRDCFTLSTDMTLRERRGTNMLDSLTARQYSKIGARAVREGGFIIYLPMEFSLFNL